MKGLTKQEKEWVLYDVENSAFILLSVLFVIGFFFFWKTTSLHKME